MLLRSILCASVRNGFVFGKAKYEDVDSAEAGMVMGIFWWIAPLSRFFMFGNSPSSCSSWRVIAASAPWSGVAWLASWLEHCW